MKHFVLSALASTMLLLPTLQGQAAPLNEPSLPQSNLVQVDWKKPVVVNKTVIHKGPNRTVVVHNRWRNGQRYQNWKRYRAVEYHRYGLRRPGPGQRWIRVDNDFLLVGMASGIIAGVVAAH